MLPRPLKSIWLQLCLGVTLLHVAAQGQTVAVLAPDGNEASTRFASQFAHRLREGRHFRVPDEDLALSAYSASPHANPFNMGVEEAARIGATIGTEAVIFVRSGSFRRSSSSRPEYYETYAAVYAFGTRSGSLLHWELYNEEASTPEAAKRQFENRTDSVANRIADAIRAGLKTEMTAPPPPAFSDAAVDAEKTNDFRAPVPYKRLKPLYTDLASLYDVRATVDAMIFLDEKGQIVRTDVVRWAGFGLDESVVQNIRSMNWRPAYAGNKPVATKFLVRYNFKKGS